MTDSEDVMIPPGRQLRPCLEGKLPGISGVSSQHLGTKRITMNQEDEDTLIQKLRKSCAVTLANPNMLKRIYSVQIYGQTAFWNIIHQSKVVFL